LPASGRREEGDLLSSEKVLVVANLKAAQLMGVESQGMVLAGQHDGLFEPG
jgi:tRNA-binding EMAP/Myf-like protein